MPCAITLLLILFICACRPVQPLSTPVDTTGFSWSVEEAPEWSSVFNRSHGWIGGDGIFMTTSDGLESPGSGTGRPVTMWFSDTQLGGVTGDSLSSTGAALIHNSFGLLEKGGPDPATAHFWWDSSGGSASAVFTPTTAQSTARDYYWLADGFVNAARANDLFIFGERITDSDDKTGFGFRVTGNTLIRVPARQWLKPAAVEQVDIPFFAGLNQDSAGLFGTGILVNTTAAGVKNGDGFVYIYGGRKGQLIVARTRPADIDRFGTWRFWTGKTWSKDPRSIVTVTDRVSNELSMTPLEDGRYLLVFQADGISPRVAFRIAASPVGPFGPLVPVYSAKDSLRARPSLYAYNAKGHPVISRPGELLISYNVNSTNYAVDIKHLPHLYRPRFIRLKYSVKR